MKRFTAVVPAGGFDPAAVFDRVVLDYDSRHRRRIVLYGEAGTVVLLDLSEAAHLRHGDALKGEEGGLILVSAAPERLVEIRAGSQAELIRIAWHLGNRHLPTQLLPDALRIRTDHVVEEMVRGLGGTVTAIEAPFDPEGGAYGHGAVHGHHHG
ncbi:urease accessory protein UreE [Mycobacterium sp. KBS0706]|uniref:urease accessory protein UreE n=1 Tax=Mycobacterium sp. KBS0706 TaxID=2578109 RepID=UPI00110FD946|nr:urease accessory protein UreE [Mycobacterium sp. KBS0706]TSD86587.1 urease accessory protein UreE [Mycobacterium sp. KBS0706]